MKRCGAIALFFVMGASFALAAGYDDLSRGLYANSVGDNALAISSFTAALAAGDLAPGYIPNAYYGRAQAYLRTGKCAEALSDLNEVIKRKADDIDAYELRASAKLCLHQPDAAWADVDAATRLRPVPGIYERFGRLQWKFGFFSQAAANFAQAFKVATPGNPHRPYLVLWYAMSASRAGRLDQAALAADMAVLDSGDWPAALLDFYRGKTTADQVNRAAARGDEQTASGQKCEADFYIAEWQLANNNPLAAKALLQAAMGECPKTFVEYSAAQVELKRQTQKPEGQPLGGK